MKKCSDCEIEKSPSEYYDSRPYTCKKCLHLRTMARRQASLSSPKSRELPATKCCPRCRQDLDKAAFSRRRLDDGSTGLSGYCRSCARAVQLERKYGIDEEQYGALFQAQAECCAICGSKFEQLNVDHDHRDGRVRGLLCTLCNTGLGNFEDDPGRLLRAIAYLSTS